MNHLVQAGAELSRASDIDTVCAEIIQENEKLRQNMIINDTQMSLFRHFASSCLYLCGQNQNSFPISGKQKENWGAVIEASNERG